MNWCEVNRNVSAKLIHFVRCIVKQTRQTTQLEIAWICIVWFFSVQDELTDRDRLITRYNGKKAKKKEKQLFKLSFAIEETKKVILGTLFIH